ncbi:ATP-binding cassette domain-containing protein [Lactobacillus ultunensis]|nr:ATP-binding cassette domain-containing protein [Lactobacillus ultunensis]KRL82700.1 ABC transporter, ATP-binding protein ABC2atp2 [Lactobacillus ultunensis DSM 16047]QQP29449.1 ATP-binding cassette domain-containing protein [Lactobacillus ultunensis]
MIELKKVTVSYSKNKIFKNFSGKISCNNLIVLMGKNGVGKSTLLDIISGLKKIDSGSLYGIPPTKKIMYMFQSTPFYSNVKVKQMLRMYKTFGRITSFEKYKISEINEFFDKNIEPLLNKSLGDLSGGETKLVFTYASAMVLKSLYLFDEPLSGVDPENRIKIINLLEDLGRKVPIIITAHEILPFKDIDCTLKYLSSNRFLFSGSYAQLIKNYGATSEEAFLNLTQEMRKENKKHQ